MNEEDKFHAFGKYIPKLRWTEVQDLVLPLYRGKVPYQRDLGGHYKNGKPKLGAKMSARFATKFGKVFLPERWTPPLVSRRVDGTLAVMDGSGRVQFAYAKEGANFLVPYLEYEGFTLTDEVAFFNAQYYAKRLGYADFMNALVTDESTEEFSAKKTLAEYGFEIGSKRDNIAAGTVKWMIERTDDINKIGELLADLRVRFDGDTCVTNKSYIQGLAIMLRDNRFDPEKLKALILEIAPESVTPHGQRLGGDLYNMVINALTALYHERYPVVNFIA